jgi:hypothetical protein
MEMNAEWFALQYQHIGGHQITHAGRALLVVVLAVLDHQLVIVIPAQQEST